MPGALEAPFLNAQRRQSHVLQHLDLADEIDRVVEAYAHCADRVMREIGYRGMSMEAVARRAGVGKGRPLSAWPSKREMIAALISDWGADATETPDTGSLAGDVEALLASILQWFEAPLTSRIFPDLVAEAQRDPKLQALLRTGVRDRRRAAAEQILQRGIAAVSWLTTSIASWRLT